MNASAQRKPHPHPLVALLLPILLSAGFAQITPQGRATTLNYRPGVFASFGEMVQQLEASTCANLVYYTARGEENPDPISPEEFSSRLRTGEVFMTCYLLPGDKELAAMSVGDVLISEGYEITIERGERDHLSQFWFDPWLSEGLTVNYFFGAEEGLVVLFEPTTSPDPE